MVLRSHSTHQPIPWGALFFAVLGLLWCGYVAFPAGGTEPCVTSGCAITKSLKIGNFSLWWLGGAYFFVLSILCLRASRYLAWKLAQLALTLDALLLLVMFVTGPCADCLIVAFFVAATTYFLRPTPHGWFQEKQAPAPLVLLPFWLGLFAANLCISANEMVPSYVLGQNTQASIRIYFAPSCPACRDALVSIGKGAALYPVIEKDGDLEAILRFENALKQGESIENALKIALDTSVPLTDASLLTKARVTIQSLRNRADVLKQGFHAMPLIEINGMPAAWSVNKKPAKTETTPAARQGTAYEGYEQGGDYPAGGQTPRSARADRPSSGGAPTHATGDQELPWNESQISQCSGTGNEPCPE